MSSVGSLVFLWLIFISVCILYSCRCVLTEELVIIIMASSHCGYCVILCLLQWERSSSMAERF